MTERLKINRKKSLEKSNEFLKNFDSNSNEKKSIIVNALMVKLRKSILINKEALEGKVVNSAAEALLEI